MENTRLCKYGKGPGNGSYSQRRLFWLTRQWNEVRTNTTRQTKYEKPCNLLDNRPLSNPSKSFIKVFCRQPDAITFTNPLPLSHRGKLWKWRRMLYQKNTTMKDAAMMIMIMMMAILKALLAKSWWKPPNFPNERKLTRDSVSLFYPLHILPQNSIYTPSMLTQQQQGRTFIPEESFYAKKGSDLISNTQNAHKNSSSDWI